MTVADLKEKTNHIGRMTLRKQCRSNLHYELQTDTLQQLTKLTVCVYVHVLAYPREKNYTLA